MLQPAEQERGECVSGKLTGTALVSITISRRQNIDVSWQRRKSSLLIRVFLRTIIQSQRQEQAAEQAEEQWRQVGTPRTEEPPVLQAGSSLTSSGAGPAGRHDSGWASVGSAAFSPNLLQPQPLSPLAGLSPLLGGSMVEAAGPMGDTALETVTRLLLEQQDRASTQHRLEAAVRPLSATVCSR